MNWKAEYDAGMAALARETRHGGHFEMCLVPAQWFNTLIKMGNEGDQRARAVVTNLDRWLSMVDQAAKDNEWPGCASCGYQIRHGEVCGWVVWLPTEAERTGMVGAFCHECFGLGPDAIAENALKLLKEQGEVLSVH